MGKREAAEFVRIVRENPGEANYLGPCAPETIQVAEAALALRFPPSYRLFVEELSMCDVGTHEFFGVLMRGTEPDVMLGAVDTTLGLRREIGGRPGTGMPEQMIAFHPDGMGGYFVLDTARSDNAGEASVLVWEPGSSEQGDDLEYVGPDFGTAALAMARRALARR